MSQDGAAVDDDILQKARNLLELATLLDIQWHGALADLMHERRFYGPLKGIETEYDLVAFFLLGLSLPIPLRDYVLAAKAGQRLFMAWLQEVNSLPDSEYTAEAVAATMQRKARQLADSEQLRALNLLMQCWETLDRLQYGYDPDDFEERARYWCGRAMPCSGRADGQWTWMSLCDTALIEAYRVDTVWGDTLTALLSRKARNG